MKKTLIFYLLTLVMPVTLFAQTEMNYWSLPPYKVNFKGASPTKTTPALLNGPSAVYSGYVTDQLNHSVRSYGSNDVAGNGIAGYLDNSTGRDAQFNQPAGIVVDGSGNIYVADKLNNVIRKISNYNSFNSVNTFAGS